MKKPILLLLLLSLSYASLLWQYSTDGPVTTKPVVYQNAIITASDDGNIYAIDPATGNKKWQARAGKEPNEVFVFDGGVVASTTAGKVVKIGSTGNVIWELNLNVTDYNVSYIYGAAANLNYIFVTANNGVYSINKNGTVRAKIATYNASGVTAPLAGTDYVAYGKGNEFIKSTETGQVQWRTSLSEGSFWLSRPVLEGGVIYIGALDNKIHAYVASNGLEMWSARARNWVVGSPLVLSGAVYFGSNDGGVYAVDSGSGVVKWVARTALAVQSQPEAGMMGGQEVIFIGSTDKSVYAISQDTGDIIWKGGSEGSVASPLFYQSEIVFGAADGKISAYSTERACSITTPGEAEVVGLKEVIVSGRYASEAGDAKVMIQVNGGDWLEANASESGWVYYLNPKTSLNAGLNTISCKIVDAGGEEVGPTFTTVAINHDPSMALSNLVITVSPAILEDTAFTVYVNDADDGSPVDRFKLTVAGKEYSGDKNVTVTISEPGDYDVAISKMGFNDASKKVTVNASGVNPLFVILGVLLIAVVLSQVWSRFLSKRFAKKK
ncbi:PQQ-binding-like beta-propeller repeat protein [Candidatus Micrarchaeota archaeon]|nr:PQQ-binding-like beta-propeller repeat protein [Candidatus Micrarchaeota archaeon]